MKHVFLRVFAMIVITGLSACATLDDETYIKAMERQDEEHFQRQMGNY